jgi:hypothetical protein
MEKKVKLFPSDCNINEFHLSLNAHCYQSMKKEGKQLEIWHRIHLENPFTKRCYIEVKTTAIKEDSTTTGFFSGLSFARYQVKPNIWKIEYLEYRRNEGFFAIGDKLDLLKILPTIYMR